MTKTKTAAERVQVSDFTDVKVAARVAAEVLRNRFRYSAGLGWLRWDGVRWAPGTDVEVTEVVRLWAEREFDEAVTRMRTGQGTAEEVAAYLPLLGKAKLTNVVTLARGVEGVRTDAAAFDSDPDLLNTPAGVVDLTTGAIREHGPDLLITKVTRGSYRPGYRSADWTAALCALDEPEREWLQARLGQAATGRPTPDGVMPVLQGSGENGKSLLTTDGPVVALGDYAGMASAKLIVAGRGTEHSTEMADLRGQRLLLAEEMTEHRALDVGTLKRIQDVGVIKARQVYRDNVQFTASHSLLMTSNYRPVVNETDHGTWRRLALLVFPRTFTKPGEPIERPDQRPGDPGLKARIRAGDDGQHDGIVTWIVEGAVRAHKEGASALAPTEAVAAATRAWRMTADRVLGFWSERLVPDRDACVLSADLLDDLNAWLIENGHQRWTRETFVPRFAEHSETRRHGVAQQRRKARPIDGRQGAVGVPGLVLRTVPGAPTRASGPNPRIWAGVRWRTDTDDTGAEP